MSKNKVGMFITELRKNKGLTQKQLAEQLNVTDKAVSRWETGKGLPESTLLIPLSNILGITVNELLSGEKFQQEDFSKKSDGNLVGACRKTEKVIKHNKFMKIFLTIAVIVCVALLIFIAKFITDSQKNLSHSGSFNTFNKTAVIDLLLDENNSFSYYNENSVCTEFDIELDSNGNFKNANFRLLNRSERQEISILLSSESDRQNHISYVITRHNDCIVTDDGPVFGDLCEFLKTADFSSMAEKFSDLKDYDKILVGGESNIFHNFNKDRIVYFGNRQHIFDGEIKHVFNSNGMSGKYYEVIISTFKDGIYSDNMNDYNGNCCSVYIAR